MARIPEEKMFHKKHRTESNYASLIGLIIGAAAIWFAVVIASIGIYRNTIQPPAAPIRIYDGRPWVPAPNSPPETQTRPVAQTWNPSGPMK